MGTQESVKSYPVTLFLAIFFGFLGLHRFYVGKTSTGLLFLFSGGILIFGWIVDVFQVAFGNFTDKGRNFIRPRKQ